MKQVFFDIDTQRDFLYPAGALYVPGAEAIVPLVERLNQYAAHQGIPVISTTDAHAEDDPEFQQWPPHCVAGTLGQQKPTGTLLARRVVIPNQPGVVRPQEIQEAQQIIIEKQALDAFTNPNLVEVLSILAPERCVVYGVVTEYCVRAAALGLLQRGYRVVLVEDAIREIRTEDRDRFFEEFRNAGGEFTTVAQICGERLEAPTKS